MVLMSIRNHVRVDLRFWLFHDGDGRALDSSWLKSPLRGGQGGDKESLISSLAIAERSEGTIEARRVKTCKGLVHESAAIAQTCQPIGRYVTFIITLRHILTTYHQNRHQWGERGRGGLAVVAMDRSHYMIVLMLASNRSMQCLLGFGSK